MIDPHPESNNSISKYNIGLFLEYINESEEGYLPRILKGIDEEAKKNNVNIFCFYGGLLGKSINQDYDDQRNILYDLASEKCLDGLIIMNTIGHFLNPSKFQEFYTGYGSIPSIGIGQMPGISFIEAEYSHGIFEAVNHLIKLHNKREIAFIDGPELSQDSIIRLSAYREALKKNNIPFNPDLVYTGTFIEQSGSEAICDFIDKRAIKFDSVFAANDNMAIGAINELQKRGILVSEDLPVIGFDDILQAVNITPSLTTVHQPIVEIGKQAVSMLLEKITEKKGIEKRTVPTELYIRQSCGCRNKDISNLITLLEEKCLSLFLEKNKQLILHSVNREYQYSNTISEESILNAFIGDIKGTTECKFLEILESSLREKLNNDKECCQIQKLMTLLLELINPYASSEREFLHSLEILRRGQDYLNDELRKADYRKQKKMEEKNIVIHTVGQSLISTFDNEQLKKVIIKAIDDLHIKSCYIYLYKNPLKPIEGATPFLLYRNGEIIEDIGKNLNTTHLIPKEILPAERNYTMIIHALYFQSESLGYMLIERCPDETIIYETLRRQISNALKGSMILSAHKKVETDLREHKENLDNIIKEKTEELVTTNTDLHHLRNYLSSIIDSMPSMLIGVDSVGKVSEWNKFSEYRTGISADEALGQEVGVLLPFLAITLSDYFNSSSPRETIKYKKQKRLAGSDVIYEDITIYPLIENGMVGAVVYIDDITEKVKMDKMMVQSEKLRSLGGLAAGLAHEINNPLAGIIQTASVLTNRLGAKNDIMANILTAEEVGISIEGLKLFMEKRDVFRMLELIKESGQRMADIINNMLSFSRKSEDKNSFFDINDLIDKTLLLAETDYNPKKNYDIKLVKIKKEYEDNIPLIPCEGMKVQQVLLNLLQNGAQAMYGGGSTDKCFILRTLFEEESKKVRIEIEDNGPGMSEEVQRRIFEPFFTTKPVGIGTGLGLSVSYFIITNDFNGEMFVESEPGKGTKIIIKLPVT